MGHLAHTLVKLMTDLAQSKESFAYIFTKFEPRKASGIPQSLQAWPPSHCSLPGPRRTLLHS